MAFSSSQVTSTPLKQQDWPPLPSVSPVKSKMRKQRKVVAMSPVLELVEETKSPWNCSDSGFFSFSESSVSASLLCSEEAPPTLSPASPPPNSSSPTLEQVLLLPVQSKEEQQAWAELYTFNTQPDYDLTELVKAMKINAGPLPSPPPTSPTSPTHIMASPTKLFGPLLPPLSSPALARLPSRLDSGRQHHPKTLPSSSPPSTSPPEVLEPIPSTWSGQLPCRSHRNPSYSSKIFLGGVPWDVTEAGLVQAFRQFGSIRIEWPGKESSTAPPKGYVYIIFDQDQNIPLLLSQCIQSGGSSYFLISSHRMRAKEVQVIPWVLADSHFLQTPHERLDPQKTVFVGALHGMLNAEALATIFSDLFSGVLYAGIDTDKHKYPIGSGRVTFDNPTSYMRAVAAAFVEIKCQKFCKKVQVDPYLEDMLCSCCLLKQGPYFCRNLQCFHYFCRQCWELRHSSLPDHTPLMKNTRSGGGPATRPTLSLSSHSVEEE